GRNHFGVPKLLQRCAGIYESDESSPQGADQELGWETHTMPKADDKFFTDKEAAKRRDEVVRRMVMTPPDHKSNHPRRKKRKTTGAARKDRARGKSAKAS